MDLQTVFYIIGIVFMVIMILLIATLVAAVFVIRSKIISLEATILQKFAAVAKVTSKGSMALYALRYFLRRGISLGRR